MQTVINLWAIVRQCGRNLGPYVMIEILMPGGTLIALLLLLHRQGKLSGIADAARGVAGHLRRAAAACKFTLIRNGKFDPLYAR